jgi:Flp pilus assembly protein CpaB
MSRRGRALAFLAGALVCAGLAAAVAGGYERSVTEQLGTLRPVVVAETRLPANRVIEPRQAERALTVRRVPERFAPPGALTSPAEAVGLEPTADLAPGAYLLAGQLAPPKRPGRDGTRVSRGLSPIEIEVTGAGALAASAGGPQPGRVDVVVTSEPGPGGRGRTYVAAESVELLALTEGGAASPDEDDPLASAGAPTVYTATLAVARPQALKLIQAENFARQVRLIPSG